ncbi:hypothetical protein BDZ45DRAFT_203481 [Acephala macrosclerotiorum]|nr:hypothetical protein BDZ45DRAFT_203481 [Acephala macrosclerotiorum]
MTKPHSADPDCDLEIDSRSKTTVTTMRKQRLQRRSPETPRRSRHHGTIKSDSKIVEKASAHQSEDNEVLDAVTEPFESRLSIVSTSTPAFQKSRTSSELMAGTVKEGDASTEDDHPDSEGSEEEVGDDISEAPVGKVAFGEEISGEANIHTEIEVVSTASIHGGSQSSIVLGHTGSDIPRSESKPGPTETSSDHPSHPTGQTKFQQAEGVEILLAQLTETTARLEVSDTQCRELTSQVKQLQKDLQDAHDFIFALQPRRPIITPAQAAEDYKSLCLNVENWVQTTLCDVLDKRRIPLSKDISPEQVEMFLGLISPAGWSAFQTPDSDEYNIIAAIMSFLCREIFDRGFWCPMEDGSLNMLDSIENSMRNLEPRRDFATVRAWRSETMAALVNRRGFLTRAQQQVDSLTSDLMALIRIFIPRIDENELFESLKGIVEPATTLAHKFHVSIDKFDVEWTNLSPKNVGGCDVTLYDCQNLLPPGRILKFPADQGKHIVYITDVCPGLSHHVVKADGYDEPQVLKKPKILVAATRWEDGAYTNPSTEDGEHATLLAWLDENRPKEKRYISWL